MGQTHTIAVRFPEGVVPRYSAATEFQGGQVVAVDFDGNRLTVAEELEETLAFIADLADGSPQSHNMQLIARKAKAALTKARREDA